MQHVKQPSKLLLWSMVNSTSSLRAYCVPGTGVMEMATNEITISAVGRLVFQLREMNNNYKQVNDT